MTAELITQLTTLVDHWKTLAADAAQKVNTTAQPVQVAYYAGVFFGIKTARNELTPALKSARAEVAKV